MLRFKLLFVIIFGLAGFSGANGLYCLSFYNHLLKNQTATSRAQFESVKSAISDIKQNGENADELRSLSMLLKGLSQKEKEDVFDFLLADYKLLAKDRASRNYANSPKRSIDFLIASIHNPLKEFLTTEDTLVIYKQYLDSFQDKGNAFLPVKMVFQILLKLNNDLINSSAYGDSKFLLFGSFVN